jgi:hypothetical protein
MYDVVIVGGGPGRAERRPDPWTLPAAGVVVRCGIAAKCTGRRRCTGSSRATETPPLELVRLGREELTPYGIETRSGTVTAVDRGASRFEIVIDERERVPTQAVLLATGICDSTAIDSGNPGVLRHQRSSLSVLRRMGAA